MAYLQEEVVRWISHYPSRDQEPPSQGTSFVLANMILGGLRWGQRERRVTSSKTMVRVQLIVFCVGH